MKYLLILLAIITVSLTACTTTDTTLENQVLIVKQDINNLRVTDNDYLEKIELLNAKLAENKRDYDAQILKVNQRVDAVNDEINFIKERLKISDLTNNELNRVRADNERLDMRLDQIEQELSRISNILSISDTERLANMAGVINVSIPKSRITLSRLEESKQYILDFAVKLINTSDQLIDGIVIDGTIESSRSIDYVAGYPDMTDSQNQYLVYDFTFDEVDDIVDWQFSRSTGNPTVYLNPAESFVFRPRLVIASDENIDNSVTFTLQIYSVTYEGK